MSALVSNFALLLLSLLTTCNYVHGNCLDYLELNDSSAVDDGSIIYLPDYGCIRGVVYNNSRAFTSIPYATPPTVANSLRFENPVDHPGWGLNETYNATTIAPACMQVCSESSVSCYKNYSTMSEDCLYLNVWTPWPMDDNKEYNVMFFIHGGSYLDGWSGSEMYNGQNLAILNDIIIVNINYRMGAFGYLYYDKYDFSGNYGYFDQLMAIEWAYNNVEYFGGKKDNIVLFGESAGAMSVGTILLNYDTSTQSNVSNMFTGAIMESNPFGLEFRKPDTWEDLASSLITFADCDTESSPGDCLRSSATSDKILSAQESSKTWGECSASSCSLLEFFAPWTPTFETDILPQSQPIWGFKKGEYNKNVPILMGTNWNEAVLFIYSFLTSSLDCVEYDAALYLLFDGHTSKVESMISKYKDDAPSDDDCLTDDWRPVASTMFTDFLFHCPNRYISNMISESTNENMYYYFYDYFYTNSSLWYSTVEECYDNTDICHAAELPEVFRPTREGFSYTERDLRVSDMMQAYWVNLAEDGAPGEYDGVVWPAWDTSSQQSMVFNSTGWNEVEAFIAQDDFKCDFWDELGYFWLEDDCKCQYCLGWIQMIVVGYMCAINLF